MSLSSRFNAFREKDPATKDPSADLGISKRTYGVGAAGEDGLVWGVVAFVGTFVTIGIAEARGWKPVINTLELIHNKYKKLEESMVSGLSNNKLGAKIFTPITTGLAVAMSGIVGHLAMLPGVRRGIKQADQAIKKHQSAIEERNHLKEENARLTKELATYRDAPAEKTFASEDLKKSPGTITPQHPSYTERVSAPSIDGNALGI